MHHLEMRNYDDNHITGHTTQICEGSPEIENVFQCRVVENNIETPCQVLRERPLQIQKYLSLDTLVSIVLGLEIGNRIGPCVTKIVTISPSVLVFVSPSAHIHDIAMKKVCDLPQFLIRPSAGQAKLAIYAEIREPQLISGNSHRKSSVPEHGRRLTQNNNLPAY